MLHFKTSVINKLHIDYNSYFYDSVKSAKFKNLFVDFATEHEYVNYSTEYYDRLRMLVLLSIYRFKQIFHMDVSTVVYNVKDIATKFIVEYYKTKGRDVTAIVSSEFLKIELNNDSEVYKYSAKNVLSAIFEDEYFEIAFTNAEDVVTKYRSTTLFDAMTKKLAEVIFGWSDSEIVLMKAYIRKFTSDFLTATPQSLNYYEGYEYQILKTLDLMDETVFNSALFKYHLNMITEIPKITDPRDDTKTIERHYVDLYNILINQPDSDVKKIIQSGLDLTKFNPIDSTKNKLTDILMPISNVKFNTSVNFRTEVISDKIQLTINPSSGSINISNVDYETIEKEYPVKMIDLKDIVTDSIDDLLFNYKQQIYQQLEQATTTINAVVNNNLDYLHTLIRDAFTFEYILTLDDVIEYLETQNFSKIVKSATDVIEAIITRINEKYDDIKTKFENDMQSIDVDFDYNFDLVNLFKQQVMSNVSYFEKQLIYFSKLLQLGYVVNNFNDNYPKFVSEFFRITSPVLEFDVSNTTNVDAILSEMNSRLNTLIGDVLPIMYLNLFSEYALTATEYMSRPTYSNYTMNAPTKQSIVKTLVIGNKPLIYSTASINTIIEKYSSELILDVTVISNVLTQYDLESKTDFIDFSRNKYYSTNPDFVKLTKGTLKYDLDLTLTETKINQFAESKLFFKPFEIYQNDPINLYNFSSFMYQLNSKGYYFDYSLSKYLSSRILDRISDRLSVINSKIDQQFYYLLITINTSLDLISYKSINIADAIVVDNNTLPLTAIQIINSCDSKYIISEDHNFVYTGFTEIYRDLILDYVVNYNNFESKKLTMLDSTGRDFYLLEYNFRLYKTLESVLSENIDQTIFDHNIIQAFNIDYLKDQIQLHNTLNPIYLKLIGEGH